MDRYIVVAENHMYFMDYLVVIAATNKVIARFMDLELAKEWAKQQNGDM
jgi:hypothetical protein